MIISSIDTWAIKIPYRISRNSSWNKRSCSHVLVARIRDRDGVAGFGDCIFKPGWQTGHQLLGEMAQSIIGMEIHEQTNIGNRLAKLKNWDMKNELCYSGAPLISCLDMALWDIAATRAEQPLYNLLGGKVQSEFQFSRQVVSAPQDELEKEVQSALDQGATALSVKLAKINRSAEDDINTIKVIRELAPKAILSADINGAWSMPTALSTLKKLEKYDLAFVESPVMGIKNMANLRQRTDVPIAIDEAGFSINRILDVIRDEAADIVILDLASLGGILGFKQAADMLAVAGIPAVIHANGEQLAPIASLHVAASTNNFGFLPHQFYYEHSESLLTNHPILDNTSNIFDWSGCGHGLGYQIDVNSLTRLADQAGPIQDTDMVLRDSAAVPIFPKY